MIDVARIIGSALVIGLGCLGIAYAYVRLSRILSQVFGKVTSQSKEGMR